LVPSGSIRVGKTKLVDTFVREVGPRRDPELIDMMRAGAPTWLVRMPWLINDAERAALHAQVVGVTTTTWCARCAS